MNDVGISMPPLPSGWQPADTGGTEIGISEMAQIFGVSLRTLRFYEEKGLLEPRRSGRERHYGLRCRRRMTIIQGCRAVGMAVDQIAELLHALTGSRSERESAALIGNALKARIEDIGALVAGLDRQRNEALRRLRELS